MVVFLGLMVVVSDAKDRLSKRMQRLKEGLGKNAEIRTAIREWERLERRYSKDYTPKRFRRRRGDLPAFGSGKVEAPRGVAEILHGSFDSVLPPWRWGLSTDRWGGDHRRHGRRQAPRRRARGRTQRRRKQPIRATPHGMSIDSELPLQPSGGGDGAVVTCPPVVDPCAPRHPKRRRRHPVSLSSTSTSHDGSWVGESLDSSECRRQLVPPETSGDGTLPRGRRGPGWRGMALRAAMVVPLVSLLLLI